MTSVKPLQLLQQLLYSGLGTPLLLVLLIAMMVLPLPPLALDMLFTFNISFALIVLLAGIYSQRPLDFAVFPTILLVTTLLRLALNIASTRIVLLNGHTGSDAAGKVIQSFGEVVVGGSYAVGFAVFIILIVINFVVITKGAGRISEVSARFTLDAMPGKQMGIDADLNAGLITQEEAKQRRTEINQEADFYGAMDGASKFVRGDAIAGILILIVNIIGGIAIGTLQHDLGFVEAIRVYGLLTIGDGLVAQIPALVLSTAAAIMVTRVSSAQDMGRQVFTELFKNPKSLIITGVILLGLGVIPGMPHFAFLSLAMICFAGGYFLQQQRSKQQQQLAEQTETEEKPAVDLSWEDVTPVDVIGLEIGYRLIPLVEQKAGGDLMARIKGVRKKLSQELGFLVPAVHVRDNLELDADSYRLTLFGVNYGEAVIHIDKELAINPGQVSTKIDGIAVRDPAFGLEAVWIDKDLHQQAQALGYTVVNSSTVVATHLSHILQNHASKLLGHDEVTQLLSMVEKFSGKLAESIQKIPTGTVVKVLQNCLNEGIAIRDLRSIAEAIVDGAAKSQDPEYLTSVVRCALSPLLIQQLNGNNEQVPVITLEPELEQILQKSLAVGTDEGGSIEPKLAEKLTTSVRDAVNKQQANGEPALLIVPSTIRSLLARFLRAGISGLNVLSYHEIPEDKQIKIVATIGR